MSEILSDEDLFRHRTVQDKAVPQKGGQKDFLPDGSWLQNKHIENYHQERERVLAEPRVQRKCDYVQGTWNPEKQLVQLTKEMRNFWEVMGFSADKRLWLQPEEALFLIETNVLQVWFEGLPMSIQEAYSVLIDEARMLAFYQVYAHLRRIGYVVIRHQGRSNFSKYERQVGLDKVNSKAARKRRLKEEKLAKSKTTQPAEQRNGSKKSEQSRTKVISEVSTGEKQVEPRAEHCEEMDSGEVNTPQESYAIYERDVDAKSHTIETSMDVIEIPDKKEENDNVKEEGEISIEKESDAVYSLTGSGDDGARIEQDMDTDYIELTNVKPDKGFMKSNVKYMERMGTEQTKKCYPIASWNYNEIKFPDFSSSGDHVVVSQPNVKHTPGNIISAQDSYIFSKKQYVNTKKLRARDLKDERKFKFSNRNTMAGKLMSGKVCNNWTEYKAALAEEKKNWSRERNLPHLYTGELRPLVDPEKATTSADVLSQLQLIEEDSITRSSSICSEKPSVLPDFDVYTPNTKFRKSSPGTPDFRIIISSMSDGPPDLLVQMSISAYLNDDVPLQCAVVDHGNVAFFSFNDLSLPIDISLG